MLRRDWAAGRAGRAGRAVPHVALGVAPPRSLKRADRGCETASRRIGVGRLLLPTVGERYRPESEPSGCEAGEVPSPSRTKNPSPAAGAGTPTAAATIAEVLAVSVAAEVVGEALARSRRSSHQGQQLADVGALAARANHRAERLLVRGQHFERRSTIVAAHVI